MTAKSHPAAKKTSGWDEPAICDFVCMCVYVFVDNQFLVPEITPFG